MGLVVASTGLILAVALWVVWLRLPMIVERQVTERLIAMGWEEPRLQVGSVGFRRLDVVGLSMVRGPWTIWLEQGTAGYRLKELMAGKLRSLDLTGLRIDLDPRHLAATPETVRPELIGVRMQASELLAQVSFRRFSVSDGAFHVDAHTQEATLSFSIYVTDTPGRELMHSLDHELDEQAEVRIQGVVDTQSGADLTVHLDVDRPDAWLAWAWPLPRPVGWADATMGRFAATFELQLPPGTGPIGIAGMIPELRGSTGDGSATLQATSFHAQWRDEGLIDGGISIRQINGRHEGIGELQLTHLAFGYEMQLRQGTEPGAGTGLTGDFVLGPISLQDIEISERWTGGHLIQVAGEVAGRGKFQICPGQGFTWWPEFEGTFERIVYGEFDVTDVQLGMEWIEDGVALVELGQARFFEGRFRAAPFRLDLRSGDFEGELELEGVSLQQLALRLPQFAGSIEGSIDGRVEVGREAGEFAIRGGRLELDRVRAGRLRYPAEGLLTAGVPAGSDEYRRLSLVEEGLKDLRLEALTVQLYDPEDPETPVKIRLEGTSVSERAIVPIRFNLNLGGDVDPLLRWWQRGAVRIDGRQSLDAGP
jgi:hypothetical protein